MGSILAPNAVFDTGFNVDGNIVAKEVTIGSENHRWDWMMPALIQLFLIPNQNLNQSSNLNQHQILILNNLTSSHQL